MSPYLEDPCAPPATRYFGPAKVLEADHAEGIARVMLTDHPEPQVTWARLAVQPATAISDQDEVLVAGNHVDDLYVIARLGAAQPVPGLAPSSRIDTGGAYAQLDRSDSSQTLGVYSKRGELIFEYDPVADKARVVMETGDIEFVTRQGDISLLSARGVRVVGQTVDVVGRSSVRMAVMHTAAGLRSLLSLGRGRARLSAEELNVTARNGDVQIDEARYTGHKLLGRVTSARWVADRVETVAGSIVEKAKNVYRTVERLSQLRAGRVRTKVDSSYHLKADQAFMKTKGDFKVDGRQIHLG